MFSLPVSIWHFDYYEVFRIHASPPPKYLLLRTYGITHACMLVLTGDVSEFSPLTNIESNIKFVGRLKAIQKLAIFDINV